MSISDRIAKRLLVAHKWVLDKTADSGWSLGLRKSIEDADRDVMDSASVKVRFASGAILKCEIADSEQAQMVGLQKYASLPSGYGMIFPSEQPRTVQFHMGTVSFPIDIIFVDGTGRVNKIVEHAEPGTREKWAMSRVSYVIEAAGGFCRDNGVHVGDEVSVGDKVAQMEYQDQPLSPDSTVSPEDRFKDHGLIDEQVDHQPMDTNWDSQVGYDPTKQLDVQPMRPAARKK